MAGPATVADAAAMLRARSEEAQPLARTMAGGSTAAAAAATAVGARAGGAWATPRVSQMRRRSSDGGDATATADRRDAARRLGGAAQPRGEAEVAAAAVAKAAVAAAEQTASVWQQRLHRAQSDGDQPAQSWTSQDAPSLRGTHSGAATAAAASVSCDVEPSGDVEGWNEAATRCPSARRRQQGGYRGVVAAAAASAARRAGVAAWVPWRRTRFGAGAGTGDRRGGGETVAPSPALTTVMISSLHRAPSVATAAAFRLAVAGGVTMGTPPAVPPRVPVPTRRRQSI